MPEVKTRRRNLYTSNPFDNDNRQSPLLKRKGRDRINVSY
jgi:hypothetical protein